MTLPNKCDSCRKLKIRCDEARPKCGGCVQRRKNCTRTQKRSIRFVNNGPLSFERRQQRQTLPEVSASESRSNSSEESAWDAALSPSTPATSPTSLDCPVPVPTLMPPGDLVWHQETSSGLSNRTPPGDPLDDTSTIPFNTLAVKSPRADQPPPSPKISYYPQSGETTLLNRWISMLSLDYSIGHPLDAWGTLHSTDIAQRIGLDAALDSCITTLLDNMHGYANRKHLGLYAPAELSVMEAAKNVRNAICAINEQQQGCRGELLFAVHLLYITAGFRSFKRGAHLIHHEASVSLLQQHRAAPICTQDDEEMNQALFHDLILGDITLALHYGRDSAFDSPTWLDLPAPRSKLPSCPGYGEAWKTVQRTAIQIPRLARLIRELQGGDTAALSSVAPEATTLAAQLHTTSISSYLDTLTTLHLPGSGGSSSNSSTTAAVATQQTTAADLAPHLPRSYVFSSARVLYLVLFHHVTRVLVAGLLQSLVAALPPHSCLFDAETVRAEDEAAAEGVAMCVEQARSSIGAEGLRTGGPLIVFPLHVAFGTWARLARRVGADAAAAAAASAADCTRSTAAAAARESGRDRLRAAAMKKLCLDVIAGIAPEWDCGVPSEEDLERKAACYAGGPLMEEDPSRREARFCCHIGR